MYRGFGFKGLGFQGLGFGGLGFFWGTADLNSQKYEKMALNP